MKTSGIRLEDLPPRIREQVLAQIGPPGAKHTPHKREKAPGGPSEPFRAAGILAQTFAEFGIPVPVVEHRFDPARRWRFDYAWPAARVALEVEGGVWTGGRHTRGKGFLADIEKYNRATVLGWRILRTTPDGLFTSPTLEALAAVLAGRSA